MAYTNIQLKGSLLDTSALRKCTDCKEQKSQRGGCEMQRGWICAACWKNWWKARNGK
jgi:hypothetical protein